MTAISNYYNHKLITKFSKVVCGYKKSTQILLIDPTGQLLVVNKRGRYKRLFPDSYTVTANSKRESNNLNDNLDSIIESVKSEIGLTIDSDRIESVTTKSCISQKREWTSYYSTISAKTS